VKGETFVINGDAWTVVDIAPAQPLAEMVAALLEDEGILAMVRGDDLLSDAFSNLGAASIGGAVVLVPQADADRALALIAETVTDYQGEELDAIMQAIASGGDPEELLGPPGEGYDGDDEDDENDSEEDDRA